MSTHIPALRFCAERAGRVVRFPACALAAKFAFFLRMSAAVGCESALSAFADQWTRDRRGRLVVAGQVGVPC